MPFIIDARNMGGGSIGSAAGGDTSTGTRNNVTLAAPWDESKEYLKGDLATNNGDLYQAQKSVPAGVQISDEDYWALVVAGDKSKETEQLRKDIGSLADLETESKDNLVDAINEVGRIQPDWNQNDETAKDYIKNRTHWVEEKAVLEETTFTIEESVGMCALGNFPATLSAGDICTVVYDGKTYTCTVFEFGTDIAGISCDAFEIVFQNQPDGLCAITIGAYAGEHTISILQTTYHTIPDEFIPWKASPTATSVLYTTQSLTEEQQAQARANIGADISTKMDKTNPTGTGSFSMNRKAGTVVGVKSHAEGNNTTASGNDSHAEGNNTTASGDKSHAEGYYTTASGLISHAEGYGTTASKSYSHAEGYYTTASGQMSHAEGNSTIASGDYSHAEGYLTIASGGFSHAEGLYTTASGQISHAEGSSTNKFSSVVTTTNPTTDSIITAWKSKKFSVAKGDYSHVEGKDNLALNRYSHAEGYQTTASGQYSHAEGYLTIASGSSSHAEGYYTTASGSSSHAEGNGTTASKSYSHAEGSNTTASGQSSHAEGGNTQASGFYSHAEGNGTTASRNYSHAEGYKTTASGDYSHAEGYYTTASGNNSHAEGNNTKANGTDSHVQGKFNIEDTSSIYADIIGNGTSDTARSNAATVDWNGNAWFAGDVYTGSTSGTNKDDGSKKLATEEYVNSSIAASGADISLGLTSAAVGQIIKVKAVDESGKPTAWEAADMTGDKWELINEITFSESANGCVINTDSNGAAFSLKAVKVECVIQIDESDPFTYIKAKYNNLTVSSNTTTSLKSGQAYFSSGALWMGSAGIMEIHTGVFNNNYNWTYTISKMGFRYNDDWKQNSISQIKIEPNDGGKPLGTGTKIYVYGVRA